MNATLTTLLLCAHAISTASMAGLVWFVQVVHYPLMAHVSPDRFAAFEAQHVARTGWVVAPLMLVEAGCAASLVLWPPANVPHILLWSGLGLLILIWLSTFLVQVPLHNRLTRGWDSSVHRRLVASNLPRTLLWSARAVLASLLLAWGHAPFGGGA